MVLLKWTALAALLAQAYGQNITATTVGAEYRRHDPKRVLTNHKVLIGINIVKGCYHVSDKVLPHLSRYGAPYAAFANKWIYVVWDLLSSLQYCLELLLQFMALL